MFPRNPFLECVWLGWATRDMFAIDLEVERENRYYFVFDAQIQTGALATGIN